MYPEWSNWWTHLEILGMPRVGKTTFMTMLERVHILNDNRLIHLAGGKTDSYDELVGFIAKANPDYPARFINATDNGRTDGYNPFQLPKGRDLSTHVSALASYATPPAGDGFQSRFPEPETAEAFFAHLAVSEKPVWEEMYLFDFANRKKWLALDLPEEFQYQARTIASTEARNWEYKTGGVRRFLLSFVTSAARRLHSRFSFRRRLLLPKSPQPRRHNRLSRSCLRFRIGVLPSRLKTR